MNNAHLYLFLALFFQANRHEYLSGDGVVTEQGVFTYLHRWLVVAANFNPQQLDTVVSNVTHVTVISANQSKV